MSPLLYWKTCIVEDRGERREKEGEKEASARLIMQFGGKKKDARMSGKGNSRVGPNTQKGRLVSTVEGKREPLPQARKNRQAI